MPINDKIQMVVATKQTDYSKLHSHLVGQGYVHNTNQLSSHGRNSFVKKDSEKKHITPLIKQLKDMGYSHYQAKHKEGREEISSHLFKKGKNNIRAEYKDNNLVVHHTKD